LPPSVSRPCFPPAPPPRSAGLARWLRAAGCAVLVAALAACGSTSSTSGSAFYRVQAGDTLTQIARRHGQSVADLVRWNRLASANRIAKGQLLRVKPPGSAEGSGPGASAAGGASSGGPGKPAASAPVTPVRGISLSWPAEGNMVQGYNGTTSKGITLVNSPGTPVVAAADGTVAYASNGLRGYGNMVIVRHDGGFLTIYAHNRTLLVREGQRVSRGQRIAEMGSSDTNRTSLYFEVRRDGKPVNPLGALPRR